VDQTGPGELRLAGAGRCSDTAFVSEADVEMVRRGIEAYNRGDVEAVLSVTDPDVVLVPVRALLDGGEYSGHEGVRRFMRDMDEDWAEREIEVDGIRDLDGTVLVLGHFRAVGRSGVELRQPLAWRSQIRDGKLTRLQAYSDVAAALNELGLSA
jgi:ketosteroid isomerase-like protein